MLYMFILKLVVYIMGVSIISYAEVLNKQTGKWELAGNVFSDKRFYTDKMTHKPFHWRSYALFGFLADIRNNAGCEPIPGLKDIPDDATEKVINTSRGWYDGSDDLQGNCLYLEDMLDFDYDKTFVDKTEYYNRSKNEIVSYRDFLGAGYFKTLDELSSLGNPSDVRVIFWFSF